MTALCCLAFLPGRVVAQIVPDGTLPVNSTVTPLGNLSEITGGTTAGNNLFHSFQQFSVPTGSAAHFNNAPNIQNIITRVTGGSISNIDGLLQANGTANLFLLNPNGIIFGPNAALNIGGSFVASTARGLKFADGTEFSATNPQSSPLLTISVPVGLQFPGMPASILNQSRVSVPVNGEIVPVGLAVQPGRTLALAGGDVTLAGGFLSAPGGRIELGSAGGNSLVSLNPTERGLVLGYEGVRDFGNIQLIQSGVNTGSPLAGGDIQVRGARVTLNEGSFISTSTFGADAAGNLEVRATDSVELTGTGSIGDVLEKIFQGNLTASDLRNGLFAASFGAGASGNLTIDTNKLIARNGAVASTSSFGEGLGGNLTVNATESAQLVDAGLLTGTTGVQKAGDLTINTNRLLIEQGGLAITGTLGAGRGGDLNVTANSVELTGTTAQQFTLFASVPGLPPIFYKPATISSGLYTLSVLGGRAGDLTIETGRLLVENLALVSTSTGKGLRSGDITVRATESVELTGTGQLQIVEEIRNGTIDPSDERSGIFTAAFLGGTVGNLTIETRQLIARNGGVAATSTFSGGQGGSLTVSAIGGLVKLSGGGLLTGTTGSSAAGEITINTGKLILQDGAVVSTLSTSAGKAGDVKVSASESVEVTGFATSATSQQLVFSTLAATSLNTGDSGNINIQTQRLTVGDGADVSVTAFGLGKSGELTVSATEFVDLSGARTNPNNPTNFSRSGLFAATEGIGKGGDLSITTPRLTVRDGARVSVSTRGRGEGNRPGGQGGNLTVNASEVKLSGTSADGQFPSGLFALSGEKRPNIQANEATGNGGNLTVNSNKLTVENGAQVSASAQGSGAAGNLTVRASSIKLDSGSSITGATASGAGGNITLNVRDSLQLRGNSQISTNAGIEGAGGDGGNITINTGTLVAFPRENSDISANATTGSGGKVNIAAQSIFGAEFRNQLTPGSDITARSEQGTQGTVEFNRPVTDPSQSLANLPENPIQPAEQIKPVCSATREPVTGEFTITGRGGLPPAPGDPPSSDTVRVGLVAPAPPGSSRAGGITVTPARRSVSLPPPATGVAFDEKGQLILTAGAPNGTPHTPWLPTANCHAR